MEIDDITRFLSQTAPFDALDASTLSTLAGEIVVRYAKRGSVALPAGAEPEYLYIVRSGAVELMELGKTLTARLGEGNCFAYPSLLRGDQARNQVTAIEDTLLYLLPAKRFHSLRAEFDTVARFFIGAEAERLRRALERSDMLAGSGSNQHVSSLVQRAPITCDKDTSLADAAQFMNKKNVTTLLVTDAGALCGILTDSDIRARAVAKQRGLDTPIRELMTANPITLSSDALVLDAQLLMQERHIHHLPITEKTPNIQAGGPHGSGGFGGFGGSGGASGYGKLIGMISTNDILAAQATNAVQIAKSIHKAKDMVSICASLEQVPTMAAQLADSSIDGARIAANIASIGLTAHRRIIEMTEAEMGPAPVPYCYLVFGSLARRDQTLSTDQDNGLLLDDSYDAGQHASYFEAFAKTVSKRLDACGYTYCGGDIMATNPKWRQTLSGWTAHFERWTKQPEPKALMHASIFFDLDAVWGNVGLAETLKDRILALASKNKFFLAHMVENAVSSKVPIGFFRRFVLAHDKGQTDRLNIKKNGVVPLTDIIRVHSLANGVRAVSVEDRLNALKETGACASADIAEMRDAWNFLMTIRLNHQAHQANSSQEPDNLIDPSTLSPFEREHLRDAFSLIKTHQGGLSRALAGGFF